jgi:hypothetical protein
MMDRLALHKSRMESDALRRQETSSFMNASLSRPGSASDPKTKFVMQIKRPMSGRHRQIAAAMSYADYKDQNEGSPKKEISVTYEGDAEELSFVLDNDELEGSFPGNTESFDGDDSQLGSSIEETSITLSGLQDDKTVQIPKVSRKSSKKNKQKDQKFDIVPMRFGDSQPRAQTISRLKSINSNDESSFEIDYMFSLEKEEDGFFLPKIKDSSIDGQSLSLSPRAQDKETAKKNKKAPATSGKNVHVRKSVAIREKPISSRLFKEVISNDFELKLFDRHANARRMPLNDDAEKWLNENEKERIKLYEEKVKKLKEDFAAKSDKKGGDKGKKETGGKKDQKKKSETVEEPPKIKPKYKSASHFMSTFFPIFDNFENEECNGPMRTQQLHECDKIIQAFEVAGLEIKRDSVYRALIIPQDRAESLCQENLRGAYEGLMTNPLPKEYWRKEMAPPKKSKKGGGKKKKK